MVKQLGDGTYGSVWKAINNQTNDVVGAQHFAQQLPAAACLRF